MDLEVLLKELMTTLGGYRFVTQPDGTEMLYRPDGTFVFAHGPAPAVVLPVMGNPPPADATQDNDGFWFRHVQIGPDWWENRRLCEDCWQEIPPYVSAPRGLVSPETQRKERKVGVGGVTLSTGLPAEGMQPLARAVCLPCYNLAFRRVYPGAEPPDIPSEILKRMPAPEPEAIGKVMVAS